MRLTMDHASKIFGRIKYLNEQYDYILARCHDAGVAVPGRKALLEPCLTLTLDCSGMLEDMEQIIDAARVAGCGDISGIAEVSSYDLSNLDMEIKNS